MAGWYWVSYALHDTASGAMIGTGAAELELHSIPATVNDVNQLADGVTDNLRDRKLIGSERYASVLSWSWMRER